MLSLPNFEGSPDEEHLSKKIWVEVRLLSTVYAFQRAGLLMLYSRYVASWVMLHVWKELSPGLLTALAWPGSHPCLPPGTFQGSQAFMFFLDLRSATVSSFPACFRAAK